MTTAPVTIGTTATQIFPAATGLVHREYRNLGTTAVDVGPAGVTTATGYPVLPNEIYDLSRFSGAFYGVSNTANQVGATIQY